MAKRVFRAAVPLAVVSLLVLGVASCGSSSKAARSSETVEATTTTTKPPLTQAQIDTALLTLNDLPAGYSTAPDSSSDSSSDSGFCPGAAAALPNGLTKKTNPQGSVQYEQTQLGPIIAEAVAAVDDGPTAFSAAKSAMDLCLSAPWTTTDSKGEVSTFTMAPMSFPPHGSDQAAYKITASATGVQADMDMVVIRVGDALMLLGGMGTTSILGSHPLDISQFTTVVDTAVAKIQAL
jgi:hypothetical protein